MAKPKLALIPAAQGSKFYSVLPSSGVGDFDFTRSGSATRINSQGLIETVASGVSRLNYPMIDGVVKGCPSHILEPQRSNLWTNSNLSSSISLDGLTRTLNQSVSPSGDSDATLFNETATTGTHRFYRLDIPSTSTDFSMSFFAKKNGINIIRIVAQGGAKFADFDLSLGTVSNESGINSSAIEDYGNGWYRCVINVTATGWVGLYALSDSSQNSYLGNVSKGVYLYGAQLEEGSHATSYIPTTTSTVTRSAETASGSGDAATFNDSEGVLMAEISAKEIANASGRRTISLSDGTNDNRVYISFDDEYNKLNIFIVVGTTQVTTSNIDISDQNSFNKITVKYKSGDSSIYVNGFLANSFNNTFSGGNFNTLKFSNRGTGELFYGNTKQIQYFDSALNDSDLETLTSWVSFEDMAISQQYSLY